MVVDSDFDIKQNETQRVTAQFLNEDGSARDITDNSELKFFFENPQAEVVVNADASYVTDGTDGKVEYILGGSQTAAVGVHKGDFLYVGPNGTEQQRRPTGDDYIVVDISSKTGGINIPEVDDAGQFTGNVDYNGYSILNANIIEGLTLRDADTGTTYDLTDLPSGGSSDGSDPVDIHDVNGEVVPDPLIADFRASSGLSVSVTEPIADTARINYRIAANGVDTPLIADDAVQATQLADAAVLPAALDATNTPADGQVPTYNAGADDWTWADAPSGSGTTDNTQTTGGTVTIPAGGEVAFEPLPHRNGETAEILRWSLSLTDGGTDGDLQLEFDPPPTTSGPTATLTSAADPEIQDGSPIASHTAGSSEEAIARIRLNHTNDSGADYLAGAGNGLVEVYVEYRIS
jgi:hypothetical protein